MSPPLALGQAVHEVIESLSRLPTDSRFTESLVVKLDQAWQKVSGKQGGFINPDIERDYRRRGEEMLLRVMNNPGPLKNLAVKIKMDLPYFWLSEEANIILCGKIDWLEYLPGQNMVNIIDFKTNKSDESSDSLQLPIYHLLVTSCQERKVNAVYYWYIGRSDEPKEIKLPDMKKAGQEILDIAQKIKTSRKLNVFKCPHKTGCVACRPMESIVKREAQFVGMNSFNEDIYILERPIASAKDESMIL